MGALQANERLFSALLCRCFGCFCCFVGFDSLFDSSFFLSLDSSFISLFGSSFFVCLGGFLSSSLLCVFSSTLSLSSSLSLAICLLPRPPLPRPLQRALPS